MSTHRCHRFLILTLSALAAAHPWHARAATDTYIGPDQGLWSDPANWSAGVPNNSFPQVFDAIITAPLTVRLDTPVTINTLALSNTSILTVVPTVTLTLANGSINNSGSLLLGNLSQLFFNANTTLTAGGSLTLDSALIDGFSNARLTTDNFISGRGTIGNAHLKLTNTGTITATGGLLTLNTANATDSFYNAGILRADGGTLRLTGNAQVIANDSGVIEALANSLVIISLSNGAISGGTIRSLGGGTVVLGAGLKNASLSGLVQSTSTTLSGSFNNAGTFTLLPGAAFAVAVTTPFVNSGLIQLLSAASFNLNSDTTLSGGGTLALAGSRFTNGFNHRLTSDNVISGFGTLGTTATRFTNNGTIVASGGILTLSTASATDSFINNGTLRANGGTLLLGGNGYYTNTNGVIEALDNSVISVGNATISGGAVRSSGGGTVTLGNSGVTTLLNTFLSGVIRSGTFNPSISIAGTVTNAGTLSILSGSLTFAGPGAFQFSPTVINNGIIQLSAGSTLNLNADTILSGAGSVTLSGSAFSGVGGKRLTTSSVISGFGQLGGTQLINDTKFTNSGTITATGGLLTVSLAQTSDAFINTGIARADLGTLSLTGGNYTNFNGTIEALPNSLVSISGSVTITGVFMPARIFGGLLRAHSGGTLVLGSNAAPVPGNPSTVLSNVTLAGKIQSGDSPIIAVSGSLTNTGTLSIPSGSLTFNPGNTLINTGLVQLGQPARVLLDGNATFSGGGSISLNNTVFYVAFQPQLTTDNFVSGFGTIHDTKITNSGTITATGGVLEIGSRDFSFSYSHFNTGILRADGGTLSLGFSGNPVLIDNTNGIIEALPNSTLRLPSGTITGGLVRSVGSGVVQSPGATLTLADLSLSGNIPASTSTLTLAGAINNAGTLSLARVTFDPTGSTANATLFNTGFVKATSVVFLNTDTAFSGGGSLSLAAQFALFATAFRLTTDNLLEGRGATSGMITNAGTISATSGSLVLTFSGASPSLNTGTLRAAGGALILTGSALQNTGGVIEARENSRLDISASITGGAIRAFANSTISLLTSALVITAPITLDNATLLVNTSTQAQSISGPGTVTIAAARALTSNAVTTTTLHINGSHILRTGSSVSAVNNLAIAHTYAGTSPFYTGLLQLTDNRLILQTTDPADKAAKLLALNEAIFAGHNGTTNVWSTTKGITSATAAADPSRFGIAVFDNAALGLSDFAGGTHNVDTNSLLLAPALLGDANFDGIVNSHDALIVTNNWNLSGLSNGISTLTWSHGDLNADGTVNANDSLVITTHWNNTTIPEPASLTLLLLATPLLLRKPSHSRKKHLPIH